MKWRESVQQKEAKIGVNIERASLGHCTHLSARAKYKCMGEQSCKEVIQRHGRFFFFLLAQHLF